MPYDVLLASREKPKINKIIWWNLLFDCYSCIVGENSQLSVSPFAWQFLLSALFMMTHANAGRKATHVLLYPVCILFKIYSAFSMGYQGMTLLYCQTQNLSLSLALERHISTHVLIAGNKHKGKSKNQMESFKQNGIQCTHQYHKSAAFSVSLHNYKG